MKRYKIGEVSKILKMPPESIRFFEQKGVLKPHKDNSNRYRYYTVWDINRLLEYRKYRELGFSLNEAIEIIKSTDFQKFDEMLKKKQKEAEEQALYYELKAIKLKNHYNILKKAQLLVGEYSVVTRPACYYYINRYFDGTEYMFLNADETEGTFDLLMEHYTFAENIYRVKQEWFHDEQETEEFQWGLMIQKRWIDALNLDILPQLTYAPPVKALYTFIQTSGKVPFSPKQLVPAMEYIKQNGYRLAGDILGIWIASVQEQGEEYRYMEVWIPIEE
ncbi:MAG: MerR family transcriptional regulator [Blautia sp.]